MSQDHEQQEIEAGGVADQQPDAPLAMDTTITSAGPDLGTVGGDETSEEDGSEDRMAERAPVGDLPVTAALAAEVQPVQPGPDLSFLKSQGAPAPDFPIDALPENMRQCVASITRSQPSSAAHVATALLATTAAAIGTAAHLQSGGYREPCVLWALLIGKSSSDRTVAVDNTANVLTMLGAAAMAEAEAPAGHNAAAALVAEERRKRLQRKIRDIEDLDGIDVATLASSAIETLPPALVTCNDLDLADIYEQLQRQPRGLLLVFLEALAFLPGSPPRSMAERAALIAGFDGSTHTYRSKGVKRYVPALHLSLCAGTHPDRLGQIIEQADDFAARCLISWPADLRDASLPSGSDAGMSELEPVLKRALSLPAGVGRFGGRPVRLSVHAAEALNVAAKRWCGLAAESEGTRATVYGHARQSALRLALVVQIMDHLIAEKHGLPATVGPVAQRAAIELLDGFYLPNAERVLAHVSQRTEPDTNLRKIARFIAVSAKQGMFNARDLREAPGSPCSRDLETWYDALYQLESLNCISKAPQLNRIGRPRTDYQVHPAFVDAVIALDRAGRARRKHG